MTSIASKVLAKHASLLFFVRVLSLVASAALYVQIARWRGPVAFGEIASWAGIAAAAAIPMDLGTAARSMRAAAFDGGIVQLRDALCWRAILLPLSLLGSLLVWLLGLGAGGRWNIAVILLVVLWAWLITVQTLVSGVLIGLGRTAAGASVLLIDKGAAAVLFLCCSPMSGSTFAVAATLPIGALISACFAVVFLKRNIRLACGRSGLRRRLRARNRFAEQLGFAANSLGAQVQSLDVPLVGWLSTPAEAGLLAGPSRLTSPLGVIAASVSSILLVQRRHSSSNELAGRRAVPPIWSVTLMTLGLTAAAVSPLLIFPANVMEAAFGGSYGNSGDVARLVALGACMSAVSQPLAADLQARSRQTAVGLVVMLGGLIGPFVVVLTATSVGALGGAVGGLAAQASVLLGLLTIRIRSTWAKEPVDFASDERPAFR